jgi:hypothetical protein
MEQEAASEKVLKETTKNCPNPNCGLHCIKICGCDHITCKLYQDTFRKIDNNRDVGHHCHFEWCWLCFAPYTEIWEAGNSTHALTCKYYEGNLPRASAGVELEIADDPDAEDYE